MSLRWPVGGEERSTLPRVPPSVDRTASLLLVSRIWEWMAAIPETCGSSARKHRTIGYNRDPSRSERSPQLAGLSALWPESAPPCGLTGWRRSPLRTRLPTNPRLIGKKVLETGFSVKTGTTRSRIFQLINTLASALRFSSHRESSMSNREKTTARSGKMPTDAF
jgi:hypothetical protein